MAENTYGFGGAEPSRDTNQGGYAPSSPAGGVKTGTGEAPDYLLSDQFEGSASPAIRGQSPVSGLGVTDTWDESLYMDYSGTVPSPSGAATAMNGAWPQKNAGSWGQPSNLDCPSAHPRGGPVPGSEANANYDGD